MIDKLHYISQAPEGGSHISAINQALQVGCRWVQLRVKDRPEHEILELALEANELCLLYGAKLIVNDHPHIALKSGAYGLHLGLEDMRIATARQIVGKQTIIGGTANTFEHIEKRVAEGADYIGLGPFRFTSTKKHLSPILGLQGFETIMQQVRTANIIVPVIAIGGILPGDVAAIMQTGVHGVAVSGCITFAEDRGKVVKHIYEQLNEIAVEN